MMYMPDCLKGTKQLLEVDSNQLKRRVYNLTAMSFTPKEIGTAIKKYIPTFEMSYNIQEMRQNIADSWPRSIDDSHARADWGWKPSFDLDGLVRDMLLQLSAKFKRENPHVKLMEIKAIN